MLGLTAGEKGISDLPLQRQERRKIDHAEVFAPEGAPAWATDRARLWNEVERTEKRRDAQLAREIVVALPGELPRVEKLSLASTLQKRAFRSAESWPI